jgi:hypothetical protein
MYCPECKIELNCGCTSCMVHSPDKPNKMIVYEGSGDDWDEQCPNCGKRESVHWWLDQEYIQYDEYRKRNSTT